MLKISNLSFAYRGDLVFQGLNLSFSRPEIVAVIGDNGAGKTTLLRLIAGELKPIDGSIKSQGSIGFLRQVQDDCLGKSGGEKTQAALAELFRQKSSILLLDEPTNNLDRESKEWLLRTLRVYPGLVLIVSHDRYFLKQVAEKIVYLHDGEAEVFCGGYQEFCDRKEQEKREQLRNYEQVQRQKKKLETQLKIAKDRAHKSNRRAYNKISDESRLKYNGRRMAAQENVGRTIRATQSKIEQVAEAVRPLERKTYAAMMSTELSHDKKLLAVYNLEKSYGKKELFGGLSFEMRTGERVRVTGRNGSGKSTLFKIILGEVTEDAGEVWMAPGLKVGCISQDVVMFDLSSSFLERNRGLDRTEIYAAASVMDFTPQDIEKPIGELSRGQMTKLAILKLILQPLDLVILDEITNHLDIRARENIEAALKSYRGAILAATHDEVFASEIDFGREISLLHDR